MFANISPPPSPRLPAGAAGVPAHANLSGPVCSAMLRAWRRGDRSARCRAARQPRGVLRPRGLRVKLEQRAVSV